ncbi:MAG: ABC transporter permease [Deltaproteobacteria bacterium]|nr:ABC transporter permease [Deltaproteobacteria bacterium]
MVYPIFIGARYVRSKKKRSISAITAIAISGVALGVAALCVTISIATGFEDEFTRKVLGVNAHVLVMKYGIDFTEYREVMETVREQPEVKGVAPFVIQEMMISKGDHTAGVLLKGVDPDLLGTVLDLPKHVSVGGIEGLRVPGSKPPSPPVRRLRKRPLTQQVDETFAASDAGVAEPEAAEPEEPAGPLPGIIVGRTLAENLKAGVGDTVQVTTPLIGLDVLGW